MSATLASVAQAGPTSDGRPGRITARGAAPGRLAGPVAAAVAVAAGLAGAFSDRGVAGWVFVAAALIGLPHGAADPVVLAWSSGRPVSVAVALRTAALYAGGVAAALVALLLSPAVAVGLALALSAWHFGTTDCAGGGTRNAAADGRRADLGPGGPRRRDSSFGRLAVTAAFGLLPVAGPLALWPHRSAVFLRRLAPSLARGVEGTGHPLLLAVLVAAVVSAAGVLLRYGRVGDLVELGVLVALVWATPPAVAVGIYFGLWHSPRQVQAILDAGRRATPGRAAAVRNLIRWAAPTTAVGLLAVGTAWALARLWPSIALVGLLAVSLPHSLVAAPAGRRPGPPPGLLRRRAGRYSAGSRVRLVRAIMARCRP